MQKKLPKNAKLVFKGFMYDVYQWKQEMFDGTKNTFERLKRNDSTAVIAVVGDKIIIQDQEQPVKGNFLSLPGGRCDKGEESLTCAKRELLEETGYVSDDVILWKIFNPVSTIFWNDCYFIARNCQKIQEQKLDSGEKIKNKLISFEEFVMLSENENFRHRGLVRDLLYFRLHPEKLEEFRRLLFGN